MKTKGMSGRRIKTGDNRGLGCIVSWSTFAELCVAVFQYFAAAAADVTV